MSNQQLLCSDIMSDHLQTPDHRYSTLKTPNSVLAQHMSINMFVVVVVVVVVVVPGKLSV